MKKNRAYYQKLFQDYPDLDHTGAAAANVERNQHLIFKQIDP